MIDALESAIKSLIPGVDEAEMAKKLMELLPFFEAAYRFIHTIQDDKLRALSMNEITRGLHYASQSGDTSLLEKALREHCTAAGCNLP